MSGTSGTSSRRAMTSRVARVPRISPQKNGRRFMLAFGTESIAGITGVWGSPGAAAVGSRAE
jgi:hypothetical protein